MKHKKKHSNFEQHYDCFIESTFSQDCSHHQDEYKITEAADLTNFFWNQP